MPIYSSTVGDRRATAHPGHGPAVATAGLVALNLLGFLLELQAGPNLDGLLQRWGLVPAEVARAVRGVGEQGALFTLVSSQFLHVGWLHLLVNVLYLGVFGAAVEGAIGSPRFVVLYLLGGAIGAGAHVLAQPDATQPAIGASGAVAAVIAANLALSPGGTLGTLAPVLFVSSSSTARDLPALGLLLVWVVAQVFSGVAGLDAPEGVMVAWWSHLGGFLGGLALSGLLRPRRRRRW